jgi:glutamate 5-kinase
MEKKKIIGIKLGSAVLVTDGKINHQLIASVCEQSAKLVASGTGVFIVTSGAIASDNSKDRSKNLRSAVGQARIMNEYYLALEKSGIDCAQMLLIDEQLIDKRNSRARLTEKIMMEAFAVGVVPIINANDVIDSEEIKALTHCADNDKLFKLMCLLVEADVAVIGFDQLGFLDLDGQVMHRIKVSEIEKVLQCAKGSSLLGHGAEGMRTKVLALVELTQVKIQTHLVSAKEENFILRAISDEEDFGTRFYP